MLSHGSSGATLTASRSMGRHPHLPLRGLVLVFLRGSENGSPNIYNCASAIEENGTSPLRKSCKTRQAKPSCWR